VKTVLGSATPSIESYANALEGKYSLVELSERYGGASLPNIIVSDTLKAVKRGERTAHFNKLLLDKIADALERHRQVMLFQNVRGFSPYVECGECGHIEMCPRCNVTLTFHKGEGLLKCHYCGYSKRATKRCPACGKDTLGTRGFGTEKAEEELRRIFPAAVISRLDRDVAQSVRRYTEVIENVEQGRTDILVGTQMITKGFDFGGVALAGVLNADRLLNFPDFRSSERAYQTILQIAGRTGRRDVQGEVVIQTSQPDNAVIQMLLHGNYGEMARAQLAERHQFFYPPYCRLVAVSMKHRNGELLAGAADMFARMGQEVFGGALLGPQPPMIDKIMNENILGFLLKVGRDKSFAAAKARLREIETAVHAVERYKYVKIIFIVDPI
jgi:primosomal protein N' (replication factor Y)